MVTWREIFINPEFLVIAFGRICAEPTLSLGAILFIILAISFHYTQRSQMQKDKNLKDV
jgi:hypothetical protein